MTEMEVISREKKEMSEINRLAINEQTTTLIHNGIMDLIITGKFTLGQSRVYVFLLRQTFGKGAERVSFSINDLAARVNLGRSSTRAAIDQLCAVGYIKRFPSTTGHGGSAGPNSYAVSRLPQAKDPEKTISKASELRAFIATSTGWVCAYCEQFGNSAIGPDGEGWNLDHRTPQRRGGRNNIENLALCCRSCNTEKGTMTAEEFLTGRQCSQ